LAPLAKVSFVFCALPVNVSLVLWAPLVTACFTASTRRLPFEPRAVEPPLLDELLRAVERLLDGELLRGDACLALDARLLEPELLPERDPERDGERFAEAERLLDGREPPAERDFDWAILCSPCSVLSSSPHTRASGRNSPALR
jgi:hypothetical protein